MEVYCSGCGQLLATVKMEEGIVRIILICTCPKCKELCNYSLEVKRTV
jgi:hypothetical protein